MTPRRARSFAVSYRPPAASGKSVCGHIFRQEGEYWTIVYDGRLFRLRDAKGLRYVAHLLRHPGERIDCRTLASAVGGRTPDCLSSAERWRLAVTKRIRASVVKIATLHPALGAHLRTHIKTGYFCIYIADPDGSFSWKR
jgi:hypothetical protein